MAGAALGGGGLLPRKIRRLFAARSLVQVRETRSSSSQKRSERGQEVLAARWVGYPWPESWGRNWSRKVRETGSSRCRQRSKREQQVVAA